MSYSTIEARGEGFHTIPSPISERIVPHYTPFRGRDKKCAYFTEDLTLDMN